MEYILERESCMKLVATDFDGTFCSYGGGVPEENLAAVRKWQEAGHKFGINTGRGISLIDMEIEKYEGLAPDFLICNNGAVVTDGERNILASLRFPQALTAGVLQLLREKRGDAPMLVVTERESLAIGGNLSDAALGLPDMPSTTQEKAMRRDDIVQISLNCGTQENALAVEAMVHASFPQLRGNINRGYLDLNLQEADKKNGIARLLRVTGWQVAEGDLFVIGDDRNDLPAIEAYHGYTVATAPDFMKKAAKKVYESVAQMMLENL